jgi:hypothetical protein
MLTVLFFTPFIAYLILGLFLKRFGEPRNFFYLLPIYFLFTFYGLKRICVKDSLFLIASILIIVFLFLSGVHSIYPLWKRCYTIKAMFACASKLEVERVAFFYNYSAFLFPYYEKKFALADKIFPFSNISRVNLKRLLRENNRVAIICGPWGDELYFDIPYKQVYYSGYFGPCPFLQKVREKPTNIKVYFLENEQ